MDGITESLRRNIRKKLVKMEVSFSREETLRGVMSKMKVVDLIYFHFSFYFHFIFDLFSIFLFLELRVKVRVTRSCSHIR